MKKLYIYGINAVLICCLIGGVLSCVTEYVPKGVEQIGGMLVVDGTITSGETFITLSRSIGILEEISEVLYVTDAKVKVICSDGEQSAVGEYQGFGTYKIETGELDFGKQYKLLISVDGKEYESAFLTPMRTAPVDSVFWTKKEIGAPVKINVAMHDDTSENLFYRWIYEENWEYHARFPARDVGGGIVYDLSTPNNIYYCWGKDSSRVLLLGSAERLSEVRISQKELTAIEPYNDRLSYLYHIHVKQMSLRKEAYDYFYNLQKNVESTGGIFGSMPTELRGNLTCVTTPDEYVIGYVEVTHITHAERYISYEEGAYERPKDTCISTTDEEEADELGLYQYDRDPAEESDTRYYSSTRCFDCRLSAFASKRKPSWWLTTHQ